MNATKHRVPIPTVRKYAYRLNRRRRASHLFALLLDTCTKVQAMTYLEPRAAEVC